MSDLLKWEIADQLLSNAREDFFRLLDSVSGQKELFIDEDLFPVINRISAPTDIFSHGVEKMYKLDAEPNVNLNRKRVYLLRPNMVRFLALAKRIRKVNIRNVHLVCIPRKLYSFEILLEQEGLWGRCSLHELPTFDMVPVDYDLFSMEYPHLYLSVYLDQSSDWLSTLASSLVNFQQSFGRFTRTLALGKLASQVARHLERAISKINDQDISVFGRKHIQTVILFDRTLDLVTPFCSQMCYEGLLDEHFGIEAGILPIPTKILTNDDSLGANNSNDASKQQNPIMKVSLTSKDDVIFGGIRSMHFTKVFQQIKASMAKQNSLRNDFKGKFEDADVSDLRRMVQTDIKDYVSANKLLKRHMDISSDVLKKKTADDFKLQLEIESDILHNEQFDETVSYIHTMICREQNKYRPLQLLCLLSAANNGLPRETYEVLCRSFFHSYGYENIPLLYKLERLNLLHVKRTIDYPTQVPTSKMPGIREDIKSMAKHVAQNFTEKTSTSKGFFQYMRKRLNLTPDVNQQVKPTPKPDMAEIFGSTYVPLSCRLIEEGLTSIDKLALLQQDVAQRGYVGYEDLYSCNTSPSSSRQTATSSNSPLTILVVFIGGCTHSELNALRLLGMSKQSAWQFYFAPTSVWTHGRLLQEIENSQ